MVLMLLPLYLVIWGCGKSADDLYQEALTLAGNSETAEKGLASFALFEKKYPGDSRVPGAVLATATLYQSLKRYDEAVMTFERLIDKYPLTAEAYKGKFLLGYMYFDDMKENEKAKRIFTGFIQAYPDSDLTVSAKMLVENMDIPVEEWSIVRELEQKHATTE